MKDRSVCAGCNYQKKRSNMRTRQECAYCIMTGQSRVKKEKEYILELFLVVSRNIYYFLF